MSKKWTKKRISETIEVLGRHTNYSEALEEIGETKDSLYNAFQRASKQAPTHYLGMHMSGKTPSQSPASTLHTGDKVYSICVINDVHIPNHNEAACKNVMDFIRDEQPDHVVINGDLMDCYWLSSFPKEPGVPDMQAEIDLTVEFLTELREAAPHAKIDYLEGNHEERLKRRLKEMVAFHSLRDFSIPGLLYLDDFDITYHKYKKPLDFNNKTLSIVHGHRVSKHSAYSAKAHLLDDDYMNIIIGHTHRMGMYYKTGHIGRRRALENGGLFDKAKLDYVVNPNWQNGFCMVYLLEDDPSFTQIQPIEMTDEGTFVWRGKLYRQG